MSNYEDDEDPYCGAELPQDDHLAQSLRHHSPQQVEDVDLFEGNADDNRVVDDIFAGKYVYPHESPDYDFALPQQQDDDSQAESSKTQQLTLPQSAPSPSVPAAESSETQLTLPQSAPSQPVPARTPQLALPQTAPLQPAPKNLPNSRGQLLQQGWQNPYPTYGNNAHSGDIPLQSHQPPPLQEFQLQQTGYQPLHAVSQHNGRFPGSQNFDTWGNGQSSHLHQDDNISPKTMANIHGVFQDGVMSSLMASSGPSAVPAAGFSDIDPALGFNLSAVPEPGFSNDLALSFDEVSSIRKILPPHQRHLKIRVLGPPSPSPPAPSFQGQAKLKQNRKLKDDPDNQPSAFYSTVDPVAPWGPMDNAGRYIFDYFKQSPELWPAKTYSRDQLIQFFLGKGRVPARNDKLIIWIQNTPAQSNERYCAGTSSGKCRWSGCPNPGRTILKGFLRVAFDENSYMTKHGTADPYHNAGYMHLYCFEEIFDLGFLIHWSETLWNFEVLIDTRGFPRENKNRMSLTRDHEELEQVFHHWKNEEYIRTLQKLRDVSKRQPMDMPSVWAFDALPRAKKDCLWRRLTDKHLSLEVKGRQATRNKRGGANIGEHRGDLRKFLELKGRLKRQRQDEDEEEDGHGDGEGELEARPRKRSRHAANNLNETSQSLRRNPPSPLRLNQTPIEQLHEFHRGHQNSGAWTRARSKDTVECIQKVLNSPTRLSRQAASELVDLLQPQPPHVRDKVISEAPEHASSLLQQQLYDDQLESRVGRLQKTARREVSNFTERLERGGDPRRFHTH